VQGQIRKRGDHRHHLDENPGQTHQRRRTYSEDRGVANLAAGTGIKIGVLACEGVVWKELISRNW